MPGNAIGHLAAAIMSNSAANEISVLTARRMYARVMSQWAMDTLELRHYGLMKPGRRGGGDSPAGPAASLRFASPRYEAGIGARDLLVWRPAARKAA